MRHVTAEQFLRGAEENVSVAADLLRQGHICIAISRIYYAMFYVASALLLHRGLTFKKHSAVVGAYGLHFARTAELDPRFHDALNIAFTERNAADYELASRLTHQAAEEQLAIAREFIEAARDYLAADQQSD